MLHPPLLLESDHAADLVVEVLRELRAHERHHDVIAGENHAVDAFGARDVVERVDDVLHVLRDLMVDMTLEPRLRPAAGLRAPRLFAFDLARGFDPAESEHEDPRRVAVDDDRGVPAVTVGEANER